MSDQTKAFSGFVGSSNKRISEASDECGYVQAASGLLIPQGHSDLHGAKSQASIAVLRALYRGDLIPSAALGPMGSFDVHTLVHLFEQISEHLPLTEDETQKSIETLKSVAHSDSSENQKSKAKEFVQWMVKSRARAATIARDVSRDESKTDVSGEEDVYEKRLSSLMKDYERGTVTPLVSTREHSDIEKMIKDFSIDDYLPASDRYRCIFNRELLGQIQSAGSVMSDRSHVLTSFLRDALAHSGYRIQPKFDFHTIQSLDALRRDFPNFDSAITAIQDSVWINLTRNPSEYLLEPLLLNGPPAVGKTTFCKAVSHALGIGLRMANVGKFSAGFVLNGSDGSWSGSKPGILARGAASSPSAWSVFLLDEIDKCSSDTRFPILPTFLDLLEPQTSRAFTDEFLSTALDMSQNFYIATSNSTQALPDPLLSRMRLIQVTVPTADQRVAIVKSLMRRSFPDFEAADELIELLASAASDLRKLRRKISDVCAIASRRHLRSEGSDIRPIKICAWDAEIANIKPSRFV